MFDGFLSSFVVIALTSIQPVVKVDIRGPVMLATGQTGMWEVTGTKATHFAVIWADGSPVSIGEYSGIPYDNEFTVNPRFTHAFSKPGSYYVQFFEKSSDGKVDVHILNITVR